MTVEISTIIKFGIGMLFIMGLIYLIAEFTPGIAKHTDDFIEKHRPKNNNDDRSDEVRSIYDLPKNKNNDDDRKEE